jgi:hypothetical protein
VPDTRAHQRILRKIEAIAFLPQPIGDGRCDVPEFQ